MREKKKNVHLSQSYTNFNKCDTGYSPTHLMFKSTVVNTIILFENLTVFKNEVI